MKIVILDAETLGEDIDLTFLNEIGETIIYKSTPEEMVAQRINDANVVILNKIKLYKNNLADANNLKLICITATGFDNVDIDYAKQHKIAVCNVKGYSTNSVAQLTVSLALSLLCHISEYDLYCKSGKYTAAGVQNCLTPIFYELCGKTWGLYGYGNIGKKVAQIAEAFGCKIIVNKQTPDTTVECVTLEELFERSDVISLHTPLNENTKHSVNEKIISKMKNSAILINTARGAIVDEEAITNAIEKKQIAGFATDVYSSEPISKESCYNRLCGFSNVIFTPHMAWGAYETRVRLLNEVAENIKAFYKGEKRNRVD